MPINPAKLEFIKSIAAARAADPTATIETVAAHLKTQRHRVKLYWPKTTASGEVVLRRNKDKPKPPRSRLVHRFPVTDPSHIVLQALVASQPGINALTDDMNELFNWLGCAPVEPVRVVPIRTDIAAFGLAEVGSISIRFSDGRIWLDLIGVPLQSLDYVMNWLDRYTATGIQYVVLRRGNEFLVSVKTRFRRGTWKNRPHAR